MFTFDHLKRNTLFVSHVESPTFSSFLCLPLFLAAQTSIRRTFDVKTKTGLAKKQHFVVFSVYL